MRSSSPSLPRAAVVVFAALACALTLSAQKHAAHKKAAPPAKLGPGTYAVFVTSKGSFTAQLYPRQAPKAVANFVALAEGKQPYKNPLTNALSMAPFYKNLLFFRTIPGYMIQTGDLLNDGTGSLGYQLPLEKNSLRFDQAGRMALAQIPGDTSSRGAEIFFTLEPVPQLDKEGFLVIGQIVRGLDIAKAISMGPRKPGHQDEPRYPPILHNVTIEVRK
ncbi:MAG: peptidylprolyl isomerase [Terriglobales bacterium]